MKTRILAIAVAFGVGLAAWAQPPFAGLRWGRRYWRILNRQIPVARFNPQGGSYVVSKDAW